MIYYFLITNIQKVNIREVTLPTRPPRKVNQSSSSAAALEGLDELKVPLISNFN